MNPISQGYNYDLFDDDAYGTNSIPTIGASGHILSVGSTGAGLSWANTITRTTDSSLSVRGPAEFGADVAVRGDITVNGRSLSEFMDQIEQRLALLHPNQELEDSWEKLKTLGEQYRELEKDILEKQNIWNKLKT